MTIVSIVTPLYNSEKYIEETIKSVIQQSYMDWELIIIDDNSNDNSVEIVEKYIKDDDRITLIKLSQNSGAAIARNTGINKSKGKYLCFLDADDIWSKEKLEVQIDFMSKYNLAFSYGDYKIIDDNGNYQGQFIAKESITFSDLCITCDIGCLSVMIDTKKIKEIVMPIIPKEDYAMWLSILKDNNIMAYKYKGVYCSYRVLKNSLSSNKYKEIFKQYNVLLKIADLSRLKSFYCILLYIFYGLKKHFIYYK
ncbi:glycosyltransferase family 2 protein [Photobacterium carnosum]|uniref:glycosyltransferase family 2 protein n=1 Tax=Photobacterium carnosum TaxID=2023717 RepID=UPI001E4E9C07|nr:glycosyltransferase family 2 protein [Photobacterium carnosum]MCD9493506.1 glycosyltransferase [Photobacterium carnosum]